MIRGTVNRERTSPTGVKGRSVLSCAVPKEQRSSVRGPVFHPVRQRREPKMSPRDKPTTRKNERTNAALSTGGLLPGASPEGRHGLVVVVLRRPSVGAHDSLRVSSQAFMIGKARAARGDGCTRWFSIKASFEPSAERTHVRTHARTPARTIFVSLQNP